ncbi:hypothetical protein N7497_009304 [Penicillium chrysogenum]|nr:hypothetical protein N7497_009304 [Penicillium chrysogenum]
MGMQSSSSDSTSHQDELTWRAQHTPPSHPKSVPRQQPCRQEQSLPSLCASDTRRSMLYISPHIALVCNAAHVIHPRDPQILICKK